MESPGSDFDNLEQSEKQPGVAKKIKEGKKVC